MKKQHAPFSIQVELVEGCNLHCPFCGIRGIRTKPGNFKYMTIKTVKRITTEIVRAGWQARIEFAMHGEPTLHPKLIDIIRMFREALPKHSLMLTTNGVGLVGPKLKRIIQLRDAGLNVIGIDDYQHVTFCQRIVEGVRKHYPDITIRRYPDDRSASVYHKRHPDTFEIVTLQDVSTTTNGNHVLANHGCQAAPPDDSAAGKRCAFPFRELAIRWNGDVAICCDDFRGTYRIGNVFDMPITDLWQHPRFQAARKMLYHGKRTFKPCKGCNAVSFRVGLLPDPTGQETLPKPTLKDLKIIEEAIADGPCTKAVLRPWEK